MGWLTDLKRGGGNLMGDVWNSVSNPGGQLQKRVNQWSGADDTAKAAAQQQQFIQQGMGALNNSYGQAQGLMAPYMQGGAQNFQDMQGMVRGGAFNPQYQQYQGPMSGGNFNPQFQGSLQNPAYQGYNGPMTSGMQAPEFQQFNGPTGYAPGGRPERMAATSENIQKFMDPGYQFRLEQGQNAIQTSAAAKGLLGSSATLSSLGDHAQGMASQEFGNAYNRFQNANNQQQADYESDRSFGLGNFQDNRNFQYGMNQDQNNWNMGAANFNQGNFVGDRAFGFQASQAPNAFNQQNADRSLNFAGMQNDFNQQNANRGLMAFNQDRTFGYGANQDLNNWNRQAGLDRYGMWNGMVGTGLGAAQAGANLATGYGQNLADLYTGAGNAAAASGMTQGNQRRGLIGDLFGMGGMLFGKG